MADEVDLAIEMDADAIEICKTIHPHASLGSSFGGSDGQRGVLRCIKQVEDPAAASTRKVHIKRDIDGKLEITPNPGLVLHGNRLYDLCSHDRVPQT